MANWKRIQALFNANNRACTTNKNSDRFIIGHITPEAQEGGPIALLRDGDAIIIDAENRTINTLLTRVCMMYCTSYMICMVCMVGML